VPVACGRGLPGRWCRRSVMDDHAGALARDLPETALHATSRCLTTQPSAAPNTCSIAWVGEVMHGDVNSPRINGMQGVRGSNPLRSTRHNASAALPLRAVCQQIVGQITSRD
jgi:hypothetical protein